MHRRNPEHSCWQSSQGCYPEVWCSGQLQGLEVKTQQSWECSWAMKAMRAITTRRRWYQVGRRELRTQGSSLSSARQWKGNTSEGRGVLENRTPGEERFQQWLPAATSERKTENGLSLLVISDFRKISFREWWFPTRSDFVTHRMFGNIWRHFWLARPSCREEILSSL